MTELLPAPSTGLNQPSNLAETVERHADRPRLSGMALPGSALSGFALAAADLLLGASCHSCGQPGVGICADCRASVEARTAFVVPADDRGVAADRRSLLVAASSVYDPILRQSISAHKDRQAWQLVGFLGDRLALAVQHLLAELDPDQTERLQSAGGSLALVPVPSTSAAVRRRGRDATAALARRAAGALELDCTVVSGLRPVRALAEQSGLDARRRRQNLAGALGVRPRRIASLRRGNSPVVLVDDLTTTGSTLAEAARALRAAGVDVLGAAVVAATERRHPVRGMTVA